MFDQLMDLVKTYSTESIVNNPDVPNEQNEAVMQEATVSVTETLQQMLSNGQTKEVMSLFKMAPE